MKLVGKRFNKIQEIELPDGYYINKNREDSESPNLYEIIVDNDSVFLLMVNYSNGYYSGWIDTMIVNNYQIDNYMSIEKQSELKEEAIKKQDIRRKILEDKLKERGMSIRDDSELCKIFIGNGIDAVTKFYPSIKTIDDIVEKMDEMNYYYTFTDYKKIKDKLYEYNKNPFTSKMIRDRAKNMVCHYLANTNIDINAIPMNIRQRILQIRG